MRIVGRMQFTGLTRQGRLRTRLFSCAPFPNASRSSALAASGLTLDLAAVVARSAFCSLAHRIRAPAAVDSRRSAPSGVRWYGLDRGRAFPDERGYAAIPTRSSLDFRVPRAERSDLCRARWSTGRLVPEPRRDESPRGLGGPAILPPAVPPRDDVPRPHW